MRKLNTFLSKERKKKHGIFRTQASFIHFSTFFPLNTEQKLEKKKKRKKETQKSQFINCPLANPKCYQKIIPFQQSKHKLEVNHCINFETIANLQNQKSLGN